ncbi:MAG: VOC family protein [Archangium sp.]
MTTQNAVRWFDIPVADLDRATKFYERITESKLVRYGTDQITGAMFAVKGVSGTLIKGHSFVPSQEGSIVYLDGGDDLSVVLSRVPDAGGKVLLPKTPIGEGRGFFAYFLDTEGNRVGLHSLG